ncbi:Uncharacterised protein [uncultured archaeon]|nr:Uncharacterised protein [uncultured archaeon]
MLSFQIGDKEGFYDYVVEFEQDGEVKARSNFKVKVEVLGVKLEFAGSKRFFDDFESTPLNFRWQADVGPSGGGNSSSRSQISQSGGALHLEAVAEPSDNGGVSEFGTVRQKQGLALYNPQEFTNDLVALSAGTSTRQATAYYTGVRSFLFPEGPLSFSFDGSQNVDEEKTFSPYGDPWGSALINSTTKELQNWGVISAIPHYDTTEQYSSAFTRGGDGHWYFSDEKYCQLRYSGSEMQKGCVKSGSWNDEKNLDRVWGVYSFVNGKVDTWQEQTSNWFFSFQPRTISAPSEFHTNVVVSRGALKNYYNDLESGLIVNGQRAGTNAKFRIYVEPKECSGPDYASLKAKGLCAGWKRFNIDELPFTMVLRDGSGITEHLDSANYNKFNIGGNYLFEKENENSIKWKKQGDTEWKHIDVTGWDTNNLGFEIQYNTNAYHESSDNSSYGDWFVTFTLIDGEKAGSEGSHSNEFIGIKSNGAVYSNPGFKIRIDISIDIEEIAAQYPDSARGTVFVDAVFENKSNREIDATGNYVLTDGNGSNSVGELEVQAPPRGIVKKRIALKGLKEPTNNYDLLLQANYENESKATSASFSGNNAPQISAPSYIKANAFRTVELDYSVTDADNDPLDVNITPPFSLSNHTWETTESDVGTKEVTITASDGFETTTKKVVIEVAPPQIECSADLDCGSVITRVPRVCEAGKLFAMETKSICLNAGTFRAQCSSIDVNRVYGYCGFKGEFSDGNASKKLKFAGAEEKTLYLEVPRKATITKAVLQVSGKQSYSQCFDVAQGGALQGFDAQNSTVKKYLFENGKKFFGLPLGGKVLVASSEVTSGQMEGFPGMSFSLNAKGVASGLDIYAYCGDRGIGWRYLQYLAPCQGGVGGTWTGEFVSSCDVSGKWLSSDFMGPENTKDISDFCVWPGVVSINSNTNLSAVHNYGYGYFSGLDPRPAFRAYVQQFQSGKELLLGGVGAEVKRVSFSASEDLRGQGIEYFDTVDGSNWAPISNNSSQEFGVNDIGEKFNWKAVLRTSDPSQTPRIIDTNICIETFGAPSSTLMIGENKWELPGDSGFSNEIDIAGALNQYIHGSPPQDGNILIPLEFSSGSTGIIALEGIYYEFDVNSNTAPIIEKIAGQRADAGKEFVLQVRATDMENDKLAYSDDSNLFDINSDTGLISFVPNRAVAGNHAIKISVSDGNLSDSSTLKLEVIVPNEAPLLDVSMDRNEFTLLDEVVIKVNAIDLDNDRVYFSSDNRKFKFDGNSAFHWHVFDANSFGDYNVTITATDGVNSVQKSVSFRVKVPEAKPPCTDSDGGLDFYTKGIADDRVKGIGSWYVDVCLLKVETAPRNWAYTRVDECSGPLCNLQEGYCNGGKTSNIAFYCELGCSKGACNVSSKVQPTVGINTTESQKITPSPSPSASPSPSPSPNVNPGSGQVSASPTPFLAASSLSPASTSAPSLAQDMSIASPNPSASPAQAS